MAWNTARVRAHVHRAVTLLGGGRRPEPETLRLYAPAAGAHWTRAGHHRIGWQCPGSLWHPCDLLLERRTGDGWSPAALLAEQVDPRSLGILVAVPPLPAGAYRVSITSPELPRPACGPPLIIEPG
ncbi:hypothetical protein NX801_13920 [Streptomyces sp. LP05-1]|uniref:Uncharacterized protein n=1 Tax=Streptomyces pyxinae TaxID=2970734 RepID=A0ABT2CH74_9ACTN|nr:hypothetical protein [Streptomyces sp. LP05-1]MCS0636738.1 hypothetical protein [Streptomyces sp. LP05-1]